jgi:hypothetical protein
LLSLRTSIISLFLKKTTIKSPCITAILQLPTPLQIHWEDP